MKALLSKRNLIIALTVLLLAAGAVLIVPRALAMPMQIKISTGSAAEATAAAGGSSGEAKKAERSERSEKLVLPAVPVTTRERIVNLADKGAYRYLKIEVVLDVALPEAKRGDKPPKGEEVKKLQEKMTQEMAGIKPRMEDAITTILSSKTSEELMTTEGKQRLKDELRAALDHLSEEFPIMGVYFTTFIIQ